MLQIYISLPWHIVDPFQFSTAYVHPRSWNIQFRFGKIFYNLFLYYWSEIVNSRSSLQIIGKFGTHRRKSENGRRSFSRERQMTPDEIERPKPSKSPQYLPFNLSKLTSFHCRNQTTNHPSKSLSEFFRLLMGRRLLFYYPAPPVRSISRRQMKTSVETIWS